MVKYATGSYPLMATPFQSVLTGEAANTVPAMNSMAISRMAPLLFV
jgi:hypothetical protein